MSNFGILKNIRIWSDSIIVNGQFEMELKFRDVFENSVNSMTFLKFLKKKTFLRTCDSSIDFFRVYPTIKLIIATFICFANCRTFNQLISRETNNK